jgi:hypothetical protein
LANKSHVADHIRDFSRIMGFLFGMFRFSIGVGLGFFGFGSRLCVFFLFFAFCRGFGMNIFSLPEYSR